MSQSNDYLSPDHLTVANQGQYLRQRREILWQSHRMTSLWPYQSLWTSSKFLP